MAIHGVALTLTYVAWDTSANSGKTGDVANHTLRWVKDGTSSAPTNSPAEVDATNCPGVYKIALTAAECQAVFGTLCGKSSTADVSIMPVSVAFEQAGFIASGTVSAASSVTQIDLPTSLNIRKGTVILATGGTGVGGAAVVLSYNSGTGATVMEAPGFPVQPDNTTTFVAFASPNPQALLLGSDDGVITSTDDTQVTAIKTKTDQLTFSAAGFVDANVMEVNDNGGLTGDGDATPIATA
jgi:hypothetical protein